MTAVAAGRTLVASVEPNATFWILPTQSGHWSSTLAQLPDPRSQASCQPSASWWRSSLVWLTFCWSTSMKLTHQMAGLRLESPPLHSKLRNTKARKRDVQLLTSSLSTFPCHLSAKWWLTAWTTMPMWPTEFHLSEYALCRDKKLPTWGAKAPFSTTFKRSGFGWSKISAKDEILSPQELGQLMCPFKVMQKGKKRKHASLKRIFQMIAGEHI